MGSVGQAALWVLLVVVIISVFIHLSAIRNRSDLWRRWSKFAMAAQFAAAAVASFALIWLLVREDFSYAYVADYTSSGLSLIYRVAAFWGGNAGSLLFWSLILTLYGAVVAFSKHEDSERMLPIVSLIMTFVVLFYTVVLDFSASPFVRLPHPAASGSGLNPLLQNPGMTVHPVNVYLGYIGFTVPFAYAMTGLILRKTDATWLRVTRRWTLISWLFLSIGIVYGAHWSYEELGWGGYWAWDPIENASLLPWLTGTAFLHSAIVQEKRGMLKAWNVILVTLTFLLTLLGTFLTRSGVLWSIHAFANSTLGTYFLGFLGLVFVASGALIVFRWRTLKAERQFEAVVSKETTFVLNNVLFLGSTFAVLWGTVFPIVSEAFTGQRMMVSSPFYNQVNLPLAVCIMLLMGIGPVVAWRRSALGNVLYSVVYPFIASALFGLAAAGILHYVYQQASWLGTCALIGAVFVILTVVMEFYRSVVARVRLTGEGFGLSFVRLISKNRRRYGGYIVHFAIAIMAIGIAGSGAYHVDVQQQLVPGETSSNIAGYRATFEGMGVKNGDGSRIMYANLVIRRGDRTIGLLQPSATFYENGQAPNTNVALYSRPLRDLYVVLLGTSHGSQAVFDFHVNPLVQLIWYGGYLFIVGTLVSLWPERIIRRHQAAVPEGGFEVERLFQELAELEYDYQLGKVDSKAYQETKALFLARIQESQHRAQVIRSALVAEVEVELASRQQPPAAPAGGVRQ